MLPAGEKASKTNLTSSVMEDGLETYKQESVEYLSPGDHAEPHTGILGSRKGHLEHPSQGSFEMLSSLSLPISPGTGLSRNHGTLRRLEAWAGKRCLFKHCFPLCAGESLIGPK